MKTKSRAVGAKVESAPAWQPTQMVLALPELPRPSATMPPGGLNAGASSYQYQLAPPALSTPTCVAVERELAAAPQGVRDRVRRLTPGTPAEVEI